ncbi:MAG: DUF5009 domain-containing protein [Terracidiphilus sp.]|jgi:predicted acyltransferase
MSISQAAIPISSNLRPGRIVSLDVFRGIVIGAMILVTDPGTYNYVYSQLRHADWMGVTATDIIFPSFLFMVGVSIPFSFASRMGRGASRASLALHALQRSAVLILLGLAVNGFPDYNWHTLRIPGILQRIALCYLCSSLLYLLGTQAGPKAETARSSARVVLISSVALSALALYWAMLKLVPVPGIGAGHLDSFGNLPAYIDRSVFGVNHLWAWGLTPGRGVTYDPEGILSTLPAMFSTLIGILAGEWSVTHRREWVKAAGLALMGVLLILAGWWLSPLLPLNKRIWTSTFALFSTGVSLLAFAVVYFVVDVWRCRRGITPALILGTNAILAFVVSSVITSLLSLHFVWHGMSETPHEWLNDRLFVSWLPVYPASLGYAIVIVLLNILLIYPLYRKRIFVRI